MCKQHKTRGKSVQSSFLLRIGGKSLSSPPQNRRAQMRPLMVPRLVIVGNIRPEVETVRSSESRERGLCVMKRKRKGAR